MITATKKAVQAGRHGDKTKGIWEAFLLVSLSLIALPAAAQDDAPRDVTATRLDGATFTGELADWTEGQVVIATAAGPQPIALEQLLSLRWRPAPAPPAVSAQSPMVVELVDGSVLPIDEFQRGGNEATLTLRGSLPQHKEFSISPRQIAAVRLQSLSEEAAPQWDEIRNLNLPGDVLVLVKRGGQSLDYVEGILGNVTNDRVEFNLDGEPVRIDRSQVAGMIRYRREAAVTKPRGIVHGRGGLRAVVASVTRTGGTLRIKTLAGVEFTWPLADVYLADFSAGKLVYLSDLEPVLSQWTPLVGLPANATAAATYGRPRRDRSYSGRPLALWFAEDATSATPPREVSYAKGIAVRSRTELVYRLPRGYRRLVAVAGIEPATAAVGNVALTIRGDDRVLLEAEIAGDRPPLAIDLDIERASRLSIIVDYGQNLDTGDWLNLCDARIVK